MSSYLKYLSNNYCCPAHVQHSSDMAFEVKEFTYFVMEARYIDMSEFFKGSIINCRMNGSNIKYRRSLIRERMSFRLNGQDSQKLWVLSWKYMDADENRENHILGLLHSNFLQHILCQRYQVELNTILTLKSLELIYRYVGSFEMFEESI